MGHAVAFGGAADREAVGSHDGAVVVLMSAAQLYGHRQFVVEVSKAAVGIEGAGIEDGMRRLLYPGFLLVRRIGPREVVIDDIL